MFPVSWLIRLEEPSDVPAIDHLHEQAFGADRFARSAFQVRKGFAHDPDLSFVALWGEAIVGSVRLTPVTIGGEEGQLLGPLAVSPDYMNKGIGRGLMQAAMQSCRDRGERFVLLVGDAPYYRPFGFEHVSPKNILMPGHVDPDRLLLALLTQGEHVVPSGAVRGLRR